MREIGLVLTIVLILGILTSITPKSTIRKNIALSAGLFPVAFVSFSIKKKLGQFGIGFEYSWVEVFVISIVIATLGLFLPTRGSSDKQNTNNPPTAEPDDARNGGNAPGEKRSP